MNAHKQMLQKGHFHAQIGFIWMTYFFNPFLLFLFFVCAFILERKKKRESDSNVKKIMIKDPVLSILH